MRHRSPHLYSALLFAFTLALPAPGLLAAEVEMMTAARTARGVGDRIIQVDLVVLESYVPNNRLGAYLPNAQIYALRHDVEPCKGDQSAALAAGNVCLKDYKRPRPLVLRANVGDVLQVSLANYLSGTTDAGFQAVGLDWLNADNGARIAPGKTQVYSFRATEEGVFMIFSPNGQTIPNSQSDLYLFGAVNVQPREAEWYRSQVTRDDLVLATYRVSPAFMKEYWAAPGGKVCSSFLGSAETGLPAGVELRRESVPVGNLVQCPGPGPDTRYEIVYPKALEDPTKKVASVKIDVEGFLRTLSDQPVIAYQAIYPAGHERAGLPVLNMLAKSPADDTLHLMHSDLTAMITGPQAGSFPYYLDGPTFGLNPATPNRRDPYREFTIAYHISPLTQQAFEAFTEGPLVSTLAAGVDAFALNYGVTGIGSAIWANRIGVGPMGINGDGVDLLFEEFFLSSWAIGDPAVLVDVPANQGRASRALYPDDPSNVYHSYIRDRVKMRVLNTGSVAPHVHHQHAHQWLHTPNSADSHYLDSQMINPGSTYTLEMTYNGSGNRNMTVGDSIFHCHIYPHFAQGMWGLWRVHDVFEQGTELDDQGRPIPGARALPDGEIIAGTPIPGLVPLPNLAMAPNPGPVRLVGNGRQVEVLPSGTGENGEKVFKNPGFPFFVPGIAGHRAPHPPMDFGWREKADDEPLLYAAGDAEMPAYREPGDRVYLDGGLPRHVVLGGEVAQEIHSRWDFTKNIAVYGPEGDLLAGSLTAMELPELGTPAEKAAMQAHATRTHPSHLPDGMPGNFTLNGLPPVPGAPYAAPDVDDNGNSTFDVRRYQAAVLQRDVVFNKQGWHYPQQRFITLLDDVRPTIDGEKPPEPFFFRANTGETVEFWHTNLVPKYYELDDFQVRTPTDVLGQHIHLVKFDVTSSDGAGNGFNYEDGTFSPDEVRDRIDTINANGGLIRYDPTVQGPSKIRIPLQVVPAAEAYGNRLGKPPAGQDWDGAQTTIQRYATDELLNRQGDDRTLRTVFTHDHFGPSTHQQVGLYGAMLVEPQGSTWKNAVTGDQMPDPKRDDGGPTSWQAVIETNNSLESYREFAFGVADMQLAYTAESPSKPGRPAGNWFTTPAADEVAELDAGTLSAPLRQVFADQGKLLPQATPVKVVDKGQLWELVPGVGDVIQLTYVPAGSTSGAASGTAAGSPTTTVAELAVVNLSQAPGWSAPSQAIWPPPPATGDAPYPTIISDPAGGGNIGLWTANYRNEPLDSRIEAPINPDHRASDNAFAYASIERGDPRLDSQPTPGSPIAKGSLFRYPGKTLLPEGKDGVQPTDPYTPLLRAYAGDRVEVRTVIGAVDSVHSFRLQGPRWYAEPSYENSGFRDTQGMGISEHFEMIFELPPAGAAAGSPPFVDSLYAASASTQGQVKGSWGILRSYQQPVANLTPLSYNPPGGRRAPADFYEPPQGATVHEFHLAAVLGKDNASIRYRRLDQQDDGGPLVLRVAAGDWIRIKLTNGLVPSDVAKLTTQFGDQPWSGNASSNAIQQPYSTSATVGLQPTLLSYDWASSAGFNVGSNKTQTAAAAPDGNGQSVIYTWYAGDIQLDEKGGRRLVPIEFGGVNLLPADPLLQASYGLWGALIVEPQGSRWENLDDHGLAARIFDAEGKPLFTEVVVADHTTAQATEVAAGSEVRLRVLNAGAGAPGKMSDNTNLIAIEGHGWPEEPWLERSALIAPNPQSQWLGTQQVTPLETYNLLLPQAGGVAKLPAEYGFYYYPRGPATRLGTLKVVAP